MNNSTEKTIELTELKNHREQQNLTVQTVADGMKVRKDFVHYIESNEFEKLGAPTFVRGHVSNYCKVLGIEPAVILAQVPGQHLQHQQLQTSDAMGSSPLSHVRRQSNHLGRYAVGTALLAMLCMSFYFIWDKWSLPSENDVDHRIASTQQDSEPKSKKKITYSSMIPQVSDNNEKVQLDSEEPENNDSTEDLGSENETFDNDLSEIYDGESTVNSDQTVNDEQGQQATIDPSDEVEPLGLAVSDSEAVSSKLNKNSYSIVMEFEEQAWVSIKTLDGEKVVQDLLGPGLREIHVTEPVHFRIGNAKKIQLKINDNVVELVNYIEQDIADFNWPVEPSS